MLATAAGELLSCHATSPISLGVDVVDIVAFAHNKNVGGLRWLRKLFTELELTAAGERIEQLATGFAGKEAVSKVLKTGFRGVGPRDIEVIRAPHGEPRIVLHGRAKEAARVEGIGAIPISLSRDGGIAIAVAIGLADALPPRPRGATG
jgi:holo-[acyl-carrier protein] synthase